MVEIVWRKRAREQEEKNLSYGQEMFGDRVAQRLFDRIATSVLLLASNPFMGSIEPLLAHRRAVYRSFVVHEHYKLVYWLDEKKEVLYIAALWDTRREPAMLAGRI